MKKDTKTGAIFRLIHLPLLGPMYLEASAEGLLSFSSSVPKEAVQEQDTAAQKEDLNKIRAILDQAVAELVQYLEGTRTVFTVPLAPVGTAFQHKVWDELLRIPYGSTKTYGEVAQKLGGLHLARAVGHAASCNRLPVFIPCHRLTGKGGLLGGFSMYCQDIGGTELKKRLLAMEVMAMKQMAAEQEEALLSD